MENVKIQMRHFWEFSKNVYLIYFIIYFQTTLYQNIWSNWIKNWIHFKYILRLCHVSSSRIIFSNLVVLLCSLLFLAAKITACLRSSTVSFWMILLTRNANLAMIGLRNASTNRFGMVMIMTLVSKGKSISLPIIAKKIKCDFFSNFQPTWVCDTYLCTKSKARTIQHWCKWLF